jgi:hypothetical protein
MTNLTAEQDQAIRQYLATCKLLSQGLGTNDEPCSIAAINLALTGELTDRIPECMSPVIGKWIITIQDAVPHEMRNSPEWKALLPLAAGTGRGHEQQRIELILDWMWETVLAALQPVANQQGFGDEWSAMLIERSERATDAAVTAASAADSASTITSAAHAAARAAYAADAADAAAAAAIQPDSWQQFNPCGLLKQLIEVNNDN